MIKIDLHTTQENSGVSLRTVGPRRREILDPQGKQRYEYPKLYPEPNLSSRIKEIRPGSIAKNSRETFSVLFFELFLRHDGNQDTK